VLLIHAHNALEDPCFGIHASNDSLLLEPSYENVVMLFLCLELVAWSDFINYKIAINFVENYFFGIAGKL
jgi:hypothetical protein